MHTILIHALALLLGMAPQSLEAVGANPGLNQPVSVAAVQAKF